MADNESAAHFDRGHAHANLGDSHQMMEDMKMAARLGYEWAQDLLKKYGVTW
jgi:hypothetical protein